MSRGSRPHNDTIWHKSELLNLPQGVGVHPGECGTQDRRLPVRSNLRRRCGAQGSQSGPSWFVLHAEKGVAAIAGKGGAINVTPGLMVPDLGRVAAIRQEGGPWVVVMDKGMTIRER